MTNLEAITAEIGIPGYNTGSVNKALLDLGIDPNGTYEAGNTDISTAALVVLKAMRAIRSIQEGGYEIVYAIDERIKDIEDGLGIGGALVTNASYFW